MLCMGDVTLSGKAIHPNRGRVCWNRRWPRSARASRLARTRSCILPESCFTPKYLGVMPSPQDLGAGPRGPAGTETPALWKERLRGTSNPGPGRGGTPAKTPRWLLPLPQPAPSLPGRLSRGYFLSKSLAYGPFSRLCF